MRALAGKGVDGMLTFAMLVMTALVCLLLLARPRLGFVGFVLLLPFASHFIPRAGPGLNAETPLVLSALLGMLIHTRAALPSLRTTLPFLSYYALLLFGMAVVITGQNMGTETVFDKVKFLKSDMWPTLMFFIAYALAPDEKARRRIGVCLTVGALLFAVNVIFGGQAQSRRLVAGSLAGNPNVLGTIIAIFSILPLLGALRKTNPNWARLAYAAAYLSFVVALVLTRSRGAWLGFMLANAVVLFATNRKALVPAAALAVVLSVGAWSLSLLPTQITDRIEASFKVGPSLFGSSALTRSVDSSIGTRIANHSMALEIFQDSPVWGFGLHSFNALAPTYGRQYGRWMSVGNSTESMLVSIIVDFGLVGLALLCWMLASLWLRGWRLAKSGQGERDIGLAFLFVFTVAMVNSLTMEAMYRHNIALPFWVFAGITARAHQDYLLSAMRVPTWRSAATRPGLARPSAVTA